MTRIFNLGFRVASLAILALEPLQNCALGRTTTAYDGHVSDVTYLGPPYMPAHKISNTVVVVLFVATDLQSYSYRLTEL